MTKLKYIYELLFSRQSNRSFFIRYENAKKLFLELLEGKENFDINRSCPIKYRKEYSSKEIDTSNTVLEKYGYKLVIQNDIYQVINISKNVERYFYLIYCLEQDKIAINSIYLSDLDYNSIESLEKAKNSLAECIECLKEIELLKVK